MDIVDRIAFASAVGTRLLLALPECHESHDVSGVFNLFLQKLLGLFIGCGFLD
jgi:hypothetical protein